MKHLGISELEEYKDNLFELTTMYMQNVAENQPERERVESVACMFDDFKALLDDLIQDKRAEIAINRRQREVSQLESAD